MVIMYNLVHGLEDYESGTVRCLRSCVDSIGRESDPVCQQEMQEHAVEPGLGGRSHARGEEQEEAEPADSKRIGRKPPPIPQAPRCTDSPPRGLQRQPPDGVRDKLL